MNEWIRLGMIPLLVSLMITIVIMPIFIPILKKFKFGQSVRVDGPQSHIVKEGTPTMGGIVFVLSTIITMIFLHPRSITRSDGLAITIVFLGYFLIGFVDDALIIIKKRNDGLKPRVKLGLQILIAVIFILVYPQFVLETSKSIVYFPIGNIPLNLGWGYSIFAVIIFVSYSNAINLTDGLDGLSSITVVIALFFMSIIALVQAQATIVIYICALIGALIGFFIFNRHPAKIFMGDTGSLALGGFYAIITILLKVEFLSAIIGLIFVLESLSVIIQVYSFKKRNKRVFRMAPLHHHFEMGPLGEQKTVILFYIAGLIFGLIGMVIYFV